MNEIYNMSKQIDFNYLTYHFRYKDMAFINAIDFKDPLRTYANINISIKK